MKENVIICGAWPYANNSLHTGHLASQLPGDIIARYFRLRGNNVFYVSGTDCHGTPITERARKENISPKDICTKYDNEFKDNLSKLLFTYDLYTNTMSTYHKEKVKEILQKIYDNGYIYEKKCLEDYCPSCDKFLSDREVIGECIHCHSIAKGDQCDNCLSPLSSSELINKKCATCNTNTIEKENQHLFFKLSSHQDTIEKYLDEKGHNFRKNAVNETRKFLNMGLIDRACTRQLDWGVEVPFEGYEDKRIYVWIEAVLGYLTALNKVCDDKDIDFEEVIRNNITYCVHGKDNIPFHTIIYPSLLSSIDKSINLPDKMISCEYVNMNDEKMSKSKGNFISVNDLISKYDVDSIRYYFTINNPEKRDLNFSLEDFIHTHNKFLVGVYGNFVNRNLSFINKKYNGVITKGIIDEEIINKTKELYNTTYKLIEDGELKQAISNIMDYVVLGNKYYDSKKPWVLAKEDETEFNNVTYTCTYMIMNMANLFSIFMPISSNKIKDMLGMDEFNYKEIMLDKDIKINNVEVLFNYIEEDSE